MTIIEAMNLAAPLADVYTALEQRLLVMIARQLSLNDKHQMNEVSKWQIQKLAQAGMLSQNAAKTIAAATKGVPGDFAEAVRTAIDGALAESGLTELQRQGEVSESAKKVVKHYRNQARDVYNQVNTVMRYKAQSRFVEAVNKFTEKERRAQPEIPDKRAQLAHMNRGAAAVVTGAESRTRAVREIIHDMAEKGIPAFVDKRGREWSPEAYVNMDVRNTVKNTATDAAFGAMDALGQDVFEVSSHAGSRPKCRPWQGKFISKSGRTTEITDINGHKYKVYPLSETTYGQPDGLFGINCGHRPRGVTDGLFTRSAKTEEEYGEDDKELYTKICRQRELERRIRRAKTEAEMLEVSGDTEGAKEMRKKAAGYNKQLREYCNQNGLKYRDDRVRTYGKVTAKKFESKEHMSAGGNDWTGADPINHNPEELKALTEFAENRGIKLYRRKDFDGDIELFKAEIDTVYQLRKDFNITDPIMLGWKPMAAGDFGETTANHQTIWFNELALRNRSITEKNLAADNFLATDIAEGIAAHEMGHIISGKIRNGKTGLDIYKETVYNVSGNKVSDDETIALLLSKVSVYSAYPTPKANGSVVYGEIISEMVNMHYTNPNKYSTEFIRLLKEACEL